MTARGANAGSDDLASRRAAIRRHLDAGAPWDACDAFREAVAARPDDPALLHEGALAHARAGATHEAHALIDRALAFRPPPRLVVELRSLRGRLWKDGVHRAREGVDTTELARRARDEYLAAYAIAHDPYPGVNAATLSLVLGERERAGALASQVLADLARRASPSSMWDLATAGEAELLAGDPGRARSHYADAVALASGDSGSVATMRRQVKLLARALPEAAALLPVLRAPDVVAFVGHMIDAPDRSQARFPPSIVPAVDAAIRARVAQWHAPVVFASAASGSDLIALDAALAAGAEVNVVLPFDREDFARTSVAPAGPAWIARFDDVLARASRVVTATDGLHQGDDALFAHAARLVEGLAVLRAAQLETVPAMLCVLDPASDAAEGGTKESFERWRRNVGAPEIIDLRSLRGAAPSAPRHRGHAPPPAATEPEPSALRRTLKTLLFADIVGYGRLSDALVPRVQLRFWDIVARVLASSRTPPRFANTWGDGLYVVLDEPRDGAELALGLAAAMEDGAWTGCGIEGTGAIRVALHAGPVFRGLDPVVGRENYFGASVTRAARIEPITPPGTVYATESFAASLASQGAADYAVEYVGLMELAKGCGEARLYRVSRA
jgi:hypothetical protein